MYFSSIQLEAFQHAFIEGAFAGAIFNSRGFTRVRDMNEWRSYGVQSS